MLRVLAIVLLTPALAAGMAWSATRVAGSTPSYAGPPPSGLVWAGRVFTSKPVLARWLGDRHVSYARWSRRHPAAAARL